MQAPGDFTESRAYPAVIMSAATLYPNEGGDSASHTRLTVNALKILKAAKVVDASTSVERRHADPEPSQFERVAPAMKVQCPAPDGTTADKRDLHLVDVDAARRFRGRRGLGECAG